MSSWKIILSTLVIFVAGALTGGLLVSVGFRIKGEGQTPVAVKTDVGTNLARVGTNNGTNLNQAGPMMGFLNPWLARERELLRRMDREMDLTPDQHKHIDTIIAVSQERTRDLWKPIAPAMNREFQLLRKEIRDQLTPEQQEKFDILMKPRQNPGRKPLPVGTNTDSVATPGAD